MKEGIIEYLFSENKALRSELGMLEVSFKIVQDAMTRMAEEDGFALANQEKDATEKNRKDDRMNCDIMNCEANYHHEASRATVGETAGIFLFSFVFVFLHIMRGANSVIFYC
ncbi:uncharacterized protein LOC143618177 [Bidens hawaiensis]|uniref:uncharacterized protein LOC143618177 n=1 Tax=Bidens hawaiensis TaxID=980011 RepID=UPI0040491E58